MVEKDDWQAFFAFVWPESGKDCKKEPIGCLFALVSVLVCITCRNFALNTLFLVKRMADIAPIAMEFWLNKWMY